MCDKVDVNSRDPFLDSSYYSSFVYTLLDGSGEQISFDSTPAKDPTGEVQVCQNNFPNNPLLAWRTLDWLASWNVVRYTRAVMCYGLVGSKYYREIPVFHMRTIASSLMRPFCTCLTSFASPGLVGKNDSLLVHTAWLRRIARLQQPCVYSAVSTLIMLRGNQFCITALLSTGFGEDHANKRIRL